MPSTSIEDFLVLLAVLDDAAGLQKGCELQ